LKIDNQDHIREAVNTIQDLELKLGRNYLDKEIERFNQIHQEIIIAVENQKQ